MEAVGQLIVSLHRNLEEIRTSLNANGPSAPEQVLLQSTLDRAEAQLRAQARQFVAAAQAADTQAAVANVCAPAYGIPDQQPGADIRRLVNSPPAGLPRPPLGGKLPTSPAAPSGIKGQRPLRNPSSGSRVRSKTTSSSRILPRQNRLDPLVAPPTLTEGDLEAGLYNLANRGFIPPASDLTPAMERGNPVIMQRPAPLYDQALKFERRDIAPADMLSSVKLDLNQPVRFTHSPDTLDLQPLQQPSNVRFQSASPRANVRQLPPLEQQSTVSLPALPAPPPATTGGGGVAESFGTFCTELLDAGPSTYEAVEPPPLKPLSPLRVERQSQAQIRAAAATQIQAHYRGLRQRRTFAKMKVRDAAARQLQRAWACAVTRMATKLELLRRQEEDRKMHTELMYQLGQDWFQLKPLRRVEVHICSLTIAEGRRRSMESYQAIQAAQVSRIFRVMDPRKDVIFVAPKFLHEDILDYYSKIMQFRGVKNPPGRFQIVVPEQADLSPRISLTQALLCSPKALKRVKKLIKGRQAAIIPEVVTPTELKLCSQLKLPMLGAGPQNMALLSSKSNSKKLCQLAQVPIGPWAVDIYDEDEFFTSLAGLVVKHPHVRTWLFKIDDERDSRGHAYIDLQKMREVMDALRLSVRAKQSSSTNTSSGTRSEDEPAVVGTDAAEVRQLLKRHVPKRTIFCNRSVYPDFASWMAEAARVGAVIQAVPETIVSQTSIHIQIDPDGAVGVLGSTEAAMCTPFVRAASWYPHTRGSWEVLQETGLRMGRVLAGKGLVGYSSIDVVFFENPDFHPQMVQDQREPTPAVIGGGTPIDPRELMFSHLRSPSPVMSESESGADGQPYASSPEPPPSLPESYQARYEFAVQLQEMEGQRRQHDPVSMILGQNGQVGASTSSQLACWIVDVDTRLTDESAALWPLQFVAQVKQDSSTGTMHLVAEAPPPEGAEKMSEEERAEKSQRWALISHTCQVPGLDRLNYQSLFQLAKMRGVSFDLFNNIGCIFTFLDVFHSLFSMLAVDRTAEGCAKRLATAVGVLADGPSSAKGGSRAKHAAPRDAPMTMNNLDVLDGLTVTDVQMALRHTLKRWAK